jgi:hypothetical protein
MSLRKTAPGVFEQFLVKWVYPRVRCREFQLITGGIRTTIQEYNVQHLLPENYPIRRVLSMVIGMGHRTQTSMFNIGIDIGSDHRWVGNIEQKTSIF